MKVIEVIGNRPIAHPDGTRWSAVVRSVRSRGYDCEGGIGRATFRDGRRLVAAVCTRGMRDVVTVYGKA